MQAQGVFVPVDALGRIVAASVRRGTGHEMLDEEMMDMIKRAQPAAAIPASLGVAIVEVVFPVRLILR